MNKFTAIGTTVHGKHLFITSEKASLELMDEVMRIIHGDAVYSIFNGHVECAYDAHVGEQLLTRAKKDLKLLQCLDDGGSGGPSIQRRIQKLQEYIAATES